MANLHRLLIVEETFLLRGRGLVVLPRVPERPHIGKVQLRLVDPDGAVRDCKGFVGPEFNVPSRSTPGYVLTLYGVQKEDVPKGTEVWLR